MKKEWSTPALEILEVRDTYKFIKDKDKIDDFWKWWEEYCKELGTGVGDS